MEASQAPSVPEVKKTRIETTVFLFAHWDIRLRYKYLKNQERV